ncbi:MAG: helix-turn-helix domain-containing protein [Novosphingobium sp.]|nr:helix-turn-helix domain-containing protein [Novosphingobium sp.]
MVIGAGGRIGPVAASGLQRLRRPGERRSVSRSATRALDVLECFGEARRPLRAVEIATALDLHPSTTNQLLKTMVESAHLTFDAQTKTYLPSPRLAAFGAWMMSSFAAAQGLHRLMCEVQARTGGIVTLTTPNDLFMQIVDWTGSGPFVGITERGLRVPIFGTAIGSAYLMELPEPAIRRLAHRGRLSKEETAILLDTIAEFREAGIAKSASEGGETISLAVPLPKDGLPAPLVLGFAGPATTVLDRQAELRTCLLAALERWRLSVIEGLGG